MKLRLMALLCAISVACLAGWDVNPVGSTSREVYYTNQQLINNGSSLVFTNTMSKFITIVYLDFSSPDASAFQVKITKPSGYELLVVDEDSVSSWIDLLSPGIPLALGDIVELSTSSTNALATIKIYKTK